MFLEVQLVHYLDEWHFTWARRSAQAKISERFSLHLFDNLVCFSIKVVCTNKLIWVNVVALLFLFLFLQVSNQLFTSCLLYLVYQKRINKLNSITCVLIALIRVSKYYFQMLNQQADFTL